jgi:hypothetical protein
MASIFFTECLPALQFFDDEYRDCLVARSVSAHCPDAIRIAMAMRDGPNDGPRVGQVDDLSKAGPWPSGLIPMPICYQNINRGSMRTLSHCSAATGV